MPRLTFTTDRLENAQSGVARCVRSSRPGHSASDREIYRGVCLLFASHVRMPAEPVIHTTSRTTLGQAPGHNLDFATNPSIRSACIRPWTSDKLCCCSTGLCLRQADCRAQASTDVAASTWANERHSLGVSPTPTDPFVSIQNCKQEQTDSNLRITALRQDGHAAAEPVPGQPEGRHRCLSSPCRSPCTRARTRQGPLHI